MSINVFIDLFLAIASDPCPGWYGYMKLMLHETDASGELRHQIPQTSSKATFIKLSAR